MFMELKEAKEIVRQLKESETPLSDAMTAKDLKEKIGSTAFNAMTKHPYYKDHVAGIPGYTEHVFFHRKNSLGYHEVHAAGFNREADKNEQGKIELKKKVMFQFGGRYNVVNAHLFKNNGEKYENPETKEKKVLWGWVHSHKTDNE